MSKLFSFIKEGGVFLSPEKKVIPVEDFTVIMDAIEILDKAKQEANEFLEEARNKGIELKKIAQKEGFEEGLKQLNVQILALDQEKKRLYHEMNKLILPLALKTAKKIVAKELEISPETIVDIVLQAIESALENHHVTIYVNHVDKELLESKKELLKEKLEQVECLSIKERADISPGGCMIETEEGIINATIESQWSALEAAFKEYLS
jgi:type III secretion protein L